MSIQLTSITKTYGTQKAVNGISLEAKKGDIVGFLGPNGAGKSTTMKILTGFIQPTEGTVMVSDIDVIQNPIEAQKKIGYLPEHNPLYLDMYVREYLQFQASIHQVAKTKVAEVIEQVGLGVEAHKKIGQLSKGYRQRVGLAAAILHNPEVLILDEPTTGLDPNQLVEIRELIKELGKDKTVLLSTHIMQEVEAMCDRVVIINKGELVIDKPISELKTSNEQVIRVTFDYKLEEQFIKRLPNITSFKNTTENNWILSFESTEDMRPVIFDFAQENGLKILGLNTENKNLESLFRELTA
ncbi:MULTISPECIES: gliding motility-associated ABC transporter ATP-binding subunit GldA [Tenacibaculum]|uniref:Gliding motility-associated ABC transporter ATP-binding subunit GldA n=1 Tax=Tenacibaculum aiptasiae TaxID=426481 RepID=A0A7J5A9Z0_9FLAO|nr:MULTISPECIES: gliding motility-associated ABC transporter ATP-binding subunit GldA [Tenacibaculum]KAB1153979.1 gliding motility-associated ABC transporter ATP-binding subunit GldA [Tenacibaculum aiptasiae]MCF2875486.1 gliding motility-associated ABC transporter ATP-binding subunit GldA [Tenacibaculum sp. Cn5-1]MCF2935562.1 gliding motility-associated ABC transporter ATP-binding subunit GldA [Tenacibaculum sp. Cn5-34]MCG7512122.1 gliding motility-associated ABC transporter ATP-binding subunit